LLPPPAVVTVVAAVTKSVEVEVAVAVTTSKVVEVDVAVSVSVTTSNVVEVDVAVAVAAMSVVVVAVSVTGTVLVDCAKTVRVRVIVVVAKLRIISGGCGSQGLRRITQGWIRCAVWGFRLAHDILSVFIPLSACQCPTLSVTRCADRHRFDAEDRRHVHPPAVSVPPPRRRRHHICPRPMDACAGGR